MSTVAVQLADLAYAQYLQPYHDDLAPEGDYCEIHLDGVDFDEVSGDSSRIAQSAFTSVTFQGGSLRRAELVDVWCGRTRWVGTCLAESGWRDVTMHDSALSGVELYASVLRRVTFHQCKIDTLNLRGSTLREVVFDQCQLGELDCTGATLRQVTFPGSALHRAHFAGATVEGLDLRGASRLELADGGESLRGAIIAPDQLVQIAPALAAAVGIVIRDR